jgi:SNF2 family DNA or RNA helicase
MSSFLAKRFTEILDTVTGTSSESHRDFKHNIALSPYHQANNCPDGDLFINPITSLVFIRGKHEFGCVGKHCSLTNTFIPFNEECRNLCRLYNVPWIEKKTNIRSSTRMSERLPSEISEEKEGVENRSAIANRAPVSHSMNEDVEEEKQREVVFPPMIPQPDGLDIQLYLHQLASVYAMEQLERLQTIEVKAVLSDDEDEEEINNEKKEGEKKEGDKKEGEKKEENKNIIIRRKKPAEREHTLKTKLGVNGDITGYGKTMSMVALVLRDQMPWDKNGWFVKVDTSVRGFGNVQMIHEHKYRKINCTLVLCSNSIIHQWKKEFDHTSLRVAVITTNKAIDKLKINDYDVVLCNNSFFNRLCSIYGNFAWKRFIYDEPSTLRIPNMADIVAGFYWFVTATPRGMQKLHWSGHGFMSNIIRKGGIDQDIFDRITVKNEKKFIRMSFKMPATQNFYYTCKNPVLKAVVGLVNSKVNSMIEAGDVAGAVEALGGKSTDNLMELIRKNKEDMLKEAEFKVAKYIRQEKKDKVEEWTKRKESIEKQIAEIDKRFENVLQSDCNICLSLLEKPVLEPHCQNLFCGSCLFTWLKKQSSCPLCRHEIKETELIFVKTEKQEDSKENKDEKHLKKKEQKEGLKTKEDTMVEIINRYPDGRFIVYSNYYNSFFSIYKCFEENNISYIEIRGTAETRSKRLESFRKGESKVAFLCSYEDCSGINLQETTDIILYHSRNNDITQQIIGRANRLGRKEPLRVHNLVSERRES